MSRPAATVTLPLDVRPRDAARMADLLAAEFPVEAAMLRYIAARGNHPTFAGAA